MPSAPMNESRRVAAMTASSYISGASYLFVAVVLIAVAIIVRDPLMYAIAGFGGACFAVSGAALIVLGIRTKRRLAREQKDSG